MPKMQFREHLAVVRGGGDLASGVVYQLQRAGFPVIVLELEQPLAIRRAVAFATAVDEGSVVIEGVKGVLTTSPAEAAQLAGDGSVAVLVSTHLPTFEQRPSVVVDARMAKRNIDTRIDQAPLVVGLGPGFDAGVDCDVVIETKRGHRLGRPIERGPALPDTGVPGDVGGATVERLVRATKAGIVSWEVSIGDTVAAGQTIGSVDTATVFAGVDGVVRGLIAPGFEAHEGLKIADIDPRGDRSACFEISDKARLVGSGVLGAVLEWVNR
jgi:xanthine dehydrogenase accessory factor